jgi:hypothetical protein
MAIAGFSAGSSLLMATFVNFVRHNDYPLLRPEIAIVALGLIAIAGAAACLYCGQRPWGRSFMEGLLAAVFTDLNSDHGWLALVIGLVVGGFSYFRRVNLLGPMAVLGVFIALASMAGIGVRSDWITQKLESSGSAGKTTRPAILHLVLDEHIGLEGLSRDDVTANQLREDLKAAYLGAGFVVYGGAYSEFSDTANAMPNILNNRAKRPLVSDRGGFRTGSTDYLAGLARRGYALTVFQPSFANYCSDNLVAQCFTYDSEALAPFQNINMALVDRFGLVTLKFARTSSAFGHLQSLWSLANRATSKIGLNLPRLYEPGSIMTSSVSSFEALGQLREVLKNPRPGEAYFVHLLAPHYPYVVDRNCRYLPRSTWLTRTTPGTIDERRQAYGEQVRCTTTKVLELVSNFHETSASGRAIVVIHGDHGSRISEVMPIRSNLGSFSSQDVVAYFSTFFAIRAPNNAPKYESVVQPVSSLLRDFAQSEFKKAPPTNRNLGPLYIDKHDRSSKSKHSVPADWIDVINKANVPYGAKGN